jgi:hypothetical protein
MVHDLRNLVLDVEIGTTVLLEKLVQEAFSLAVWNKI